MILSKQFPVGGAIPTELQFQEEYNVSRHTIRQAISILVNEGYLRREKGSGTYVNDMTELKNADSSTGNVNKTIGVITTYISDYIFPTIIRGIEKELKASGYSLLLSSTNNDYAQEKECLDRMVEFGVDGLIVEPTKSNQYNPNLTTYVTLREQKIPIVMINAAYEELDIPSICVDDVEVGYIATKELIEHHHKKLLLVTKIDDLQGKYRMKGFIKACEAYEIPITSNSILTFTTMGSEQFYDDVIAHLKNNPEFTGIVCYNDQVANTLIGKLTENGYQVPEDISIVGNDNSTLSKGRGVNLTTTEHPKDIMGTDAAKWIVKTIENGAAEESILYSSRIIRGDSVKELKM